MEMAHSIFIVVLERVMWNLDSKTFHLDPADLDYSYLLCTIDLCSGVELSKLIVVQHPPLYYSQSY